MTECTADFGGLLDRKIEVGNTWDIYMKLTNKETKAPIDLTGYGFRMMMRIPGASLPTLEVTTPGFYASAPTLWPSYELLTVTPLTGEVRGKIPPDKTWKLSPLNQSLLMKYAVSMMNPAGVIPPPDEIFPIDFPAGEDVYPVLRGDLLIEKREADY